MGWSARLLGLGIMTIVGCNNEAREALDEARQRWTDNRPDTYELETRRSCFCGPQTSGWFHVQVDGKEVISFERIDDSPDSVTPDEAQDYFTVEGQFVLIDDALTNDADEVEARYDKDLGYPISVSIDREKNAADDELSLDIRELSAN